jgi:hypothetical protein
MWDGREPALATQAADATLGHAQATSAPPSDVLGNMVVGETSTYFAQQTDAAAGDLASDGAMGGPDNLARQSVASSPDGFGLFAAWSGSSNPRRAAIARGESIFDTRMFTVSGKPATCSTCHDTPNVGTSSQGLLFDVGISDPSRRTPDLPLYTFLNSAKAEKRQTTDPGQGLISGKWSDLGRFKVPGLRGLAARAPYFHDGSAATLADVVDYFDARFQIGLSGGDKDDLVAFLGAL